MKDINFNQIELNEGYDVLRSISHDLRLRIVSLINDLGQVNVNEIYKTLNLEQSITSQHLKVLRDSKIVETKREGKMIYYSLNHEKILKVNRAISNFEELTKARKRIKANPVEKQ